MSQLEDLLEAERRGILDSETEALMAEARSRDLIPRSAKQIDETIGAPARVRALVGGLDRPEDRLATLRKFFPDAAVDPTDSSNFVFTDPESGLLTKYNPPGMDLGDVASISREAAQFTGGAAGAVAGTPGGLAGAMAGSALGAAAGEEVFNLAARAAGAEDTRGLGERALDTAITGAAGIMGPAGGAAAGAAIRGGVRATLRGGEAGRKETAQAIEDLARFGTDPSLAQASRNQFLDTVESFISRMPGGAGRIRDVSKKMQETVSAKIEQKTATLANTMTLEPEIAGRTAMKGIAGPGGFVERFKIRADLLFDDFATNVPPKTRAPVTNTRAALDELVNQVPEIPALNQILTNPNVVQIAKALPDEPIPFEVLKKVRSSLGRKLANPSLVDDIPRAEMKQLYAAISRDMEAVARASGPKAERAFERANGFYSAGLSRIEDTLEPLIKNRVPEAVFGVLERAGKQGPTLLRTVRRSVTPDQWKIIVGTTIRRLGKASPSQQLSEGGEFSFQTFLTNWNKLDKGAKAELFNVPGLRQVRMDFEALARASERIRESSQAFNNPSGTAGALTGQVMILSGAVAALSGDLSIPLFLTMAAGGGNLTARLITNPAFVRWLARGTKIEAKGFAAHVGRLSAVAAVSTGEDKEAIKEFLGLVERGTRRSTEGNGQ